MIDSMRAEDTAHLDMLFHREADDVMHRLLVHAEPAIAASAAVSFDMGARHGPTVPPEWQAAWRSAEHDADTFEEWFCQRLQDMTARGWYASPLPHDGDGILARLPRPHRLRLASRCIGLPRIGPSALIHLVNSDIEMARHLLDEYAVTPDELVEALAGQRNKALEQIGPLLLERGVRAEKIAAAAAWYDTWWGDRSRMHSELLAYFTALADHVPALRAVAAAGRSQQQELLRDAEEQERAARVRGR
ncbi:hypothetical protein [Streptomyces sp. CB03234]|uniref:hypothetical protein n=1 Tax=Streptomyces sp. (strain CB03234) TaxID=1703937 RepID=UPI00117D0A4A|nr:hypothetical protein [Streptomyces sp. CB03234]